MTLPIKLQLQLNSVLSFTAVVTNINFQRYGDDGTVLTLSIRQDYSQRKYTTQSILTLTQLNEFISRITQSLSDDSNLANAMKTKSLC